MPASGEEEFIAKHLAPLADGFPGAFGLTDDCAELAPLPGHSLVFKTDPIVEGVHFFSHDPPKAVAWKALAVNVSDLAAKGVRPVAYLMALAVPAKPDDAWIHDFSEGLRAAQDAFGCVLIGGDTDRRDGPLSVAVTVIGEVRCGCMVQRSGAAPGDAIYVSGELGGAALGMRLRMDDSFGGDWPLGAADREAAQDRYLMPLPKLGLRAALQTYARSAMDISDGLIKDLDRMCRLTDVGAELELQALPLAAGVVAVLTIDQVLAVRLLTSGDDYEVLATVPPNHTAAFEKAALSGGVSVSQIGRVSGQAGVRLFDSAGSAIEIGATGWDHFDRDKG